MSQLGDDLFHEGRKDHLEVFGNRVLFGFHDLHLFADAQRVVGADLRAEAVLERRDDAAARRVVLGVGAGDHEEVEGKAHAISADLHVLLFHDVEQPDLDALREVGQLVDTEDAAIRARHEAVVDGQLVREVATLRDLDGVHLADEVGDRDVGRGQLLAVAAVAVDPLHLDAVAILGDQVETPPADRRVRVVVDLASGDAGHVRVEQGDERTHDAALRLAALAEQDDVVTRDHGVGQLRQHRVVVTHDPVEQRLAAAKAGQEITAHFLLDGFALVPARANLTDGLWADGAHLQHYRQDTALALLGFGAKPPTIAKRLLYARLRRGRRY